ncbi:MAG: septum formation initiator family protein [Pseudomonadota bacterium]
MSRLATLIGFAVIALLVIGLYRAKSGASDTEKEIAEVEAAIAEAEERQLLLEAELAHLSRREWIEDYARNQLGMGPARAEQFVREAELGSVLGPVGDAGDGRVARQGEGAQ